MTRGLRFAMTVIGAMLMATSGFAQTTGGDTFDGLSPGNKMIAEALFEAQATDAAGDSTWTLEQISSAKADGQGWGQVFRQMQSDGVIEARNLGQVVSEHVRASAPPPPAPGGSQGSQGVVIMNGANGASVASEPGPSAAAERGRSNRGNAGGRAVGRPSFSSSGSSPGSSPVGSSPAGGPPAGGGAPVISGANGAVGGFTPPGQANGASASGGNGLGRGRGR